MALKQLYTREEAQRAIDRTNGQSLDALLNGTALGDPKKRNVYNATGKKLGHEYMHRGYEPRTTVAGLGMNRRNKSRSENRRASAELAAALLNSTAGQNALAHAQTHPGDQYWLQHIPVTEDIYGYERGEAKATTGEVARKITKGSVNFRNIGGMLFIFSVYPEEFAGERDFNLSSLFGDA